MNATQRKQIEEIISKLQECQSQLDDLANEEREKFDNMPAGLQESEAGQAMDEAANALEAARDNVDAGINDLENLP